MDFQSIGPGHVTKGVVGGYQDALFLRDRAYRLLCVGIQLFEFLEICLRVFAVIRPVSRIEFLQDIPHHLHRFHPSGYIVPDMRIVMF